MAHRTILTERQRSVLFDLPIDETAMLRHYILADDDLEIIRARRRHRRGYGNDNYPATDLSAPGFEMASTLESRRWEPALGGGGPVPPTRRIPCRRHLARTFPPVW